MENLIDSARAALPGDAVKRLSSMLHENEDNTRAALEQAVPASLAGLAAKASSDEGARGLLEMLKQGDYPQVEAADMSSVVSDPKATARVAASGEGFVTRLFGIKVGEVVERISDVAGVSQASAIKLVGFAAPLVMGLVRKAAVARNLDPRALRGFLSEQTRMGGGQFAGAFGMMPAMAGGPSLSSVASTRPAAAPVRPVPVEPRRSFLPWVLGGLAAVAAIALISGRSRSRNEDRSVAQTSAPSKMGSLPAPGKLEVVAAGSTAPLLVALESDEPLPKRLLVSGLEYRTDSAEIAPQSARVLDDVAAALMSHASATIRVEGHTDATGDAATNQTLSEARAAAAKQHLVNEGIAADRITAAGLGATEPVASNDDSAGRAKNRRTEIVVTAR